MSEEKKGLRYKPASVRYLVYALGSLAIFAILCVCNYFMIQGGLITGDIKWVFNGVVALISLGYDILIYDRKEQEKIRKEKYKDR